ncbi:hypothetical protein TNCV_1280441 [Trichonephila clavipes]|nr:hypothetical protein TNCV_1280441 [Trichonephila clavipes]
MTESHDSSSLSSEHTLPYGSKDSSDCSICLSSDDSEQYTLSQCKHTFHSNCLKQWVESGKHTCPYCRGQLCNSDKISIGCGPSAFKLLFLRDILGVEPEEMSDTDSESDLYSDSDSESYLYSDSDSESDSIPVLEFIPNTVDRLIEDMLQSRH